MAEETHDQGTLRYVRCPSCGMPNPGNAQFCSRCKKPMREKAPQIPLGPLDAEDLKLDIMCPRCGQQIPADSKFCGFCGAPLTEGTPAHPPAAPPRPAPRPVAPQPVRPPGPPPAPHVPKAAPPAPKPSSSTTPTAPIAPVSAPRPAAAPPAAKPAAPVARPPAPLAPPPAQETVVFTGMRTQKVEAAITEVRPDGTTGKATRIVKETVVGRGICDLSYPDDALLSVRHAAVQKREGKLFLKDLESQNGTYIKQRQDTELHPGDVFLLGRELFRFSVQRLDESAAAQGTMVMTGAPKIQPGPHTARLEQIQLSGELIKSHSLDKAKTVIGRVKGDLVFNDDPYMSGTHACILALPGRFILQDLKSRNGVYRRIRDEIELKDADEFFLGEQLFRVEIKTIEE